MGEFMSLSSSVWLGAVLGLLLMGCFMVLLFMTDFGSSVGRQYRVTLRCPMTGGRTAVHVSEGFRFGRVTRSVRRCSFAEQREHCGQECLKELGRQPA